MFTLLRPLLSGPWLGGPETRESSMAAILGRVTNAPTSRRLTNAPAERRLTNAPANRRLTNAPNGD